MELCFRASFAYAASKINKMVNTLSGLSRFFEE
jgi:hypothetical protein